VLNSFDEDVEFISYAPVDVFPYLGRKHGKTAVADTMRKVFEQFEFLTYQPIFLVVEGNDASAIVIARFKQRTSGRIIHLILAHFIRFQNDRIIELREFMDSFDAVQQVLGHELALPRP
jgi:ketosteroid isomerase-like protein